MGKPRLHVPHLKMNEAILSVDTAFGYRDYFLIEIVEDRGGLQIRQHNIDIDKWYDYIKEHLQIDYTNKFMTAYCRPERSLRKWYMDVNELHFKQSIQNLIIDHYDKKPKSTNRLKRKNRRYKD